MFGRKTRALEAIATELRRSNELAEQVHRATLAELQLQVAEGKVRERATAALETIRDKLAESAASAEQAREAASGVTSALAPLLERILAPREARVVIQEGGQDG